MILEKICAMENLQEAWKRVRINKPGPGIDRVRWEDFEKNLSFNLNVLREKLQKEHYTPLPVMVFKKPNSKGTHRTIGISSIKDKVVQQAIAIVLGARFNGNFLPCCYAYRNKMSAQTAANKAGQCIKEGNLWHLKMDVENFFDSIDHLILLGLIEKEVDEKPVVRLISKLLKTKIFKEMGLFDNLTGSQQGSGLSPLLSNIYLHPLDVVMWREFKDKYIRYSDDIAVFCNEKETLEKARQTVETCLAKLKLKSHPAKTAISHVAGGIVYLGFFLDTRGKGPGTKAIEQLHESLSQYDKVRKTDDIQGIIVDIKTKIRGWYNYYKTLKPISPPNILSLIALAQLTGELGENRNVRELVRQSGNFQHKHSQISFLLGELFLELGMQTQAMREFARALELDPAMDEAKQRIQKLQNSEKDIHQIIEQTKLILHRNPHYTEGYQKLAECYTKLGLFGFAEKAYNKAIELDDELQTEMAFRTESAEKQDQGTEFEFSLDDQELFYELFKGRKDAYSKQWVDERGKGGFMHVNHPLKKSHIYKHLKGNLTLAVYPVTAKETVNFIVFDIDISNRQILGASDSQLNALREKTHQEILRIKNVCNEMGLSLYIEDSGYKGRHGWLFFNRETPVSRAVHLGNEIIKKAGGPSQDMIWELFPKGRIDRHLSAIKLPLGINRKNNKRCLFLNDSGKPEQDQAGVLKSIQKNDIDKIKIISGAKESASEQSIIVTDAGEIQAPTQMFSMVNKCKLIKHLINKARDTNYLNHYERVCLLYTLTFAGKEGVSFLHKVMAYCINYDFNYTQRQVERRKESPVSCAKLMENFFELAETLPCDCKFQLPPRSYPSPVLYLLEAELDGTCKSEIFPERKMKNNDKKTDENQDLNNQNDSDENSILNFEEIFSVETSGLVPKQASFERKTDITNLESSACLQDQPVDMHNSNIPEKESKKQLPSKQKVADLFTEYLTFRQKQKKIDEEIGIISEKMEKFFDSDENNTIETMTGIITRAEDNNGNRKWILEVSGA